jgi:sugar lactone lactonase YvrE
VKVVNDEVSTLGEAPYWDSANQVLYYVDVLGGTFNRLDPVTRQLRKVNKGEGVQFIIPYADGSGNFVVSRKHELWRLNFENETETVLARVRPELPERERFNDAKCDARGRLFTGTILYDAQENKVPNGGALYRLDGNRVVQVAQGFTVTNGFAWSNDQNSSKLYLNDSEGRKIYHFDYDIQTGNVTNQRLLIDCDKSPDFVPGEFPDGMVMDNQGFIWVAMWNGGRVVKIDVDMARVVDQVRLENVTIPSSLAKGVYQGNDGYFVTTATVDIPPGNLKPDDGKILHISFQGGEVYTFKP